MRARRGSYGDVLLPLYSRASLASAHAGSLGRMHSTFSRHLVARNVPEGCEGAGVAIAEARACVQSYGTHTICRSQKAFLQRLCRHN